MDGEGDALNESKGRWAERRGLGDELPRSVPLAGDERGSDAISLVLTNAVAGKERVTLGRGRNSAACLTFSRQQSIVT